ESVAAALVARELRPVDDDHVPSGSGERDGGSRTSGAAADHDDVGLQHGPRLLAVPETGQRLAGLSVIVEPCAPTASSPSFCCCSSAGRSRPRRWPRNSRSPSARPVETSKPSAWPASPSIRSRVAMAAGGWLAVDAPT